MKGYKLYKHFIKTNTFNIGDKIKELKKNARHGNKNRKTKN